MTHDDEKFDRLLKAMAQGEAPKAKATKDRGQESPPVDKQASQG